MKYHTVTVVYYETSTCFQKPVLRVHQTTAKISFTTLDPVVRVNLEIRFCKSKTPFQSIYLKEGPFCSKEEIHNIIK